MSHAGADRTLIQVAIRARAGRDGTSVRMTGVGEDRGAEPQGARTSTAVWVHAEQPDVLQARIR